MALKPFISAAGVLALALSFTACSSEDSTPHASTPMPSTTQLESPTPSETPLPDLTAKDIQNAKIPSMCGFPAGKLKNGELPKDHPEYPNASHPQIADDSLVVAGDMTGDGLDEVAAVFYCDMGGVSWPGQIQLFESTKKGAAPLGKPYEIGKLTGGARAMPDKFTLKNGEIQIHGLNMNGDDVAAAPTGEMKASIAWDGKRLYATKFDDLQTDTKALDTSRVNGTWCIASRGKTTTDCLEVLYPEVLIKGEDPRQVGYGFQEGRVSLSYFDAPMGVFFEPGDDIDILPLPEGAHAVLDQPRIYNSQTGELFVKQDQ